MGDLNIIPGDNNSGQVDQAKYAAPGVIELTVPVDITTTTILAAQNAITTAAQDYLGLNLPGPFHHVVYVLEKCYVDCGWAAVSVVFFFYSALIIIICYCLP